MRRASHFLLTTGPTPWGKTRSYPFNLVGNVLNNLMRAIKYRVAEMGRIGILCEISGGGGLAFVD